MFGIATLQEAVAQRIAMTVLTLSWGKSCIYS